LRSSRDGILAGSYCLGPGVCRPRLAVVRRTERLQQALPALEERAKQTKDFIAALTQAAGDDTAQIEFKLACIDKTPRNFSTRRTRKPTPEG
jgi:hypothetical protein